MTIFWYVVQTVCAFLYVNFLEWSIHKYVLHGLGKKKGSFFSFHWYIHHRRARKQQYFDQDYNSWPKWKSSGKEVAGLLLLALLHLPLFWVVPVFYISIVQGALAYYLIHSHSHRDPAWGKKWFPWHWDHHMGKDQDANYCVTSPFFDYVFGTRKRT